ncbi:MAG TPA: hypothetical protein DCP69_07245 [Candidatus Omnitrophica bacterium]|nr:hypothetical protein [Candidatus Omnitrophota bacterium]
MTDLIGGLKTINAIPSNEKRPTIAGGKNISTGNEQDAETMHADGIPFRTIVFDRLQDHNGISVV